MTGKGTFVFANATTNAEFGYDIGLPQLNGFSFFVHLCDLVELDGLVMRWTVFLTDYTGTVFSKRQAACFVKDRLSNNKSILFRLAQFAYCPSRTNLPAQGAVEFAVAQSWNKPWGKHALITTLHKTWLQCVLNAYFHALAAAYASGEKFCLACRTWWAEQSGTGHPVSNIYLGKQWHGDACQSGPKKGSTTQVDLHLIVWLGKTEPGWLIDTVINTVHAKIALLMSYLSAFQVKSIHSAGWCAVLTVFAGLSGKTTKN